MEKNILKNKFNNKKKIKVMFIGNSLGGDDGIGPYLYSELKDNNLLKNYELMELGVIGLDMLSYIEDNDKVIIVDALRETNEQEIGKIRILSESDLTPDLKIISQHDFGVEETAKILRIYKPSLDKLTIIGINVRNINSFDDNLSNEIKRELPRLKQEVINNIIKIAESK